ncbi:MAG: hypothetical protein WBM76_01525 [Woeseiaceae bacterium]
MKIRVSTRHLAVWALLAGLALRAVTPLGYMPAAFGSGSLFALCPGQLPPGFVLPGATNDHEHHHHSTDDTSSSEPDSCQMGHLLSSAAAIGEIDRAETVFLQHADVAEQPATPSPSAARLVIRSRGPPA